MKGILIGYTKHNGRQEMTIDVSSVDVASLDRLLGHEVGIHPDTLVDLTGCTTGGTITGTFNIPEGKRTIDGNVNRVDGQRPVADAVPTKRYMIAVRDPDSMTKPLIVHATSQDAAFMGGRDLLSSGGDVWSFSSVQYMAVEQPSSPKSRYLVSAQSTAGDVWSFSVEAGSRESAVGYANGLLPAGWITRNIEAIEEVGSSSVDG